MTFLWLQGDETGNERKNFICNFFVLPGYILEWRRISTFIHQRLMGWILVVLYFYDHCRVSWPLWGELLSCQNVVISFSSTSRPCVLCSFVTKPHRFVSQDSVLRVQIKSSPIPLSFRTFLIGKVWRQGTQVGYGSYFLCRLDLIWPQSYGNFHGICHYCIDSSLSATWIKLLWKNITQWELTLSFFNYQ